jgi:hypothetical protein
MDEKKPYLVQVKEKKQMLAVNTVYKSLLQGPNGTSPVTFTIIHKM